MTIYITILLEKKTKKQTMGLHHKLLATLGWNIFIYLTLDIINLH